MIIAPPTRRKAMYRPATSVDLCYSAPYRKSSHSWCSEPSSFLINFDWMQGESLSVHLVVRCCMDVESELLMA